MIKFYLNVLSGKFESENDAVKFADLDFSEDEDNPSWPISEELGDLQFEADFLETIWGEKRYEYLKSLLVEKSDLEIVKQRESEGNNTFFLIMEHEENKNIKIPEDTGRLNFCGRYLAHYD